MVQAIRETILKVDIDVKNWAIELAGKYRTSLLATFGRLSEATIGLLVLARLTLPDGYDRKGAHINNPDKDYSLSTWQKIDSVLGSDAPRMVHG